MKAPSLKGMGCGCSVQRLGSLRYLNPPEYNDGAIGYGPGEPLQLSGWLGSLRYLNPPVYGGGAERLREGSEPLQLSGWLGSLGLTVSNWPPVAAYILYLDTLHYTSGPNGQPYQVEPVPVSYYGPPAMMAVPISDPPPDSVSTSGGVNVYWLGTLNAVGEGTANGYATGTKQTEIPDAAQQIAQSLAAQAGGAPVAIGLLSQSTSIGAFMQQLAKLQAAPPPAAPAATLATPNTTQSGQSSSYVAPIVTTAPSLPATPTAPLVVSTPANQSSQIAPQIVTVANQTPELPIVSEGPATTAPEGVATSQLPWLLLIGLALVAAVAVS